MELTPKALSDAGGISQSYASMILSGDRTPSLEIALRIYDQTGQQFGILKGLSDSAIDELRGRAAA
jgi:transcriptional regulator with XRE-family HTH domain